MKKLLLLLLTLTYLSACVNRKSLNHSPQETLISFTSDKSPGQIYLYSLNDNIVTSINIKGFPAKGQISNYHYLSENDQWIIEIQSETGSDIFLLSSDGSKLINLTNTPDVLETETQVSPNQSLVAYTVSNDSINTHVEIMEITSKRRWRVSEDGYFESSPYWLDNTTLILESYKLGSPNIFQVDILTNEWNNLSKGPGVDTGFSLAPEVRKMAFLSDRNGGWEPYIYNFSTQETYGPISELKNVSSLSFSPTGVWLIANITQSQKNEIILFNVENKVYNKIATISSPSTNFQWSKDSKQVLFTATLGEQVDVYLYDIERNFLINVTNNPEMEFNAKWLYPNEESHIFRISTTRK